MKCHQHATVIVPDHLAEMVYRMAQEFYSDPANVAEFEAWKAEQDAAKTAGGGETH